MIVSSMALDPVEKKPLARFHPGTHVLSVGSVGCTMHCPWCQNHEIAQPRDAAAVPVRNMAPDELAELAVRLAAQPPGNIGVAYTYNEPFAHCGDVLACARAVHERGLINIAVTNGLIGQGRLAALLPYLDAFNIDLKGFTQRAYDMCGGRLDIVMRTIEAAVAAGAHVEATMLLVPGVSDDERDIARAARWLAGVNPDITLHLTRFFPRFRYAEGRPTPLSTMHRSLAAASEHLEHVLLGNL